MSGDLRVQRITSADDLAALEPAWWRLWRAIPDASPFTAPAWLLSWWQVFAPGELRMIAIWKGDELVALAPLYLERGEYGIRLLPLGIGISDDFDVLVQPCHGRAEQPLQAAAEGRPGRPDRRSATAVDSALPATGLRGRANAIGMAGSSPAMTRAEGEEIVRALIEALAAEPDWGALSLEELPPSAAALNLRCPAHCTDDVAEQSASPILSLSCEDDDPLACLPSRKRRKLRMAQNRTARRSGEVRAVGANGVEDFLSELSRLHGARWTTRGEDGVLADDTVQRFHAAALPRLVRAGLARLYRLTIDGRVVGSYYGLQHGGTAYAYIGGFDPDFAFESPGTVLIGHALAEAAGTGATEFNFLRGQEPYKYEWGAVDRWSYRRTIRRASHD